MRFASVRGRLQLVRDDSLVDVGQASGGTLPSSTLEAFERWDDVLAWARSLPLGDLGPLSRLDLEELDAPSPRARQILAIGLNYADHADESGIELPPYPFVFTKTFGSLAAPVGELLLPSDTIDWEVEIVVVIGRAAHHVPVESAWDHVAGLTVGQDFSDREVQNRLGVNSQPTLGKSRQGFGPIGPFLVTPDEFDDRDAIALWTTVNGIDAQRGTTADLVFDIPALVSYLSSVLPLLPGDIIFTGTPAGVGMGRTPPIYLKHGDVVETGADVIGTMRHVARRA